MNDLKFDEILVELYRIHTDFPDLRFGQVIQVAIDKNKRMNNFNIGDVSSKLLLKALQDFNTYTKKVRKNDS